MLTVNGENLGRRGCLEHALSQANLQMPTPAVTAGAFPWLL